MRSASTFNWRTQRPQGRWGFKASSLEDPLLISGLALSMLPRPCGTAAARIGAAPCAMRNVSRADSGRMRMDLPRSDQWQMKTLAIPGNRIEQGANSDSMHVGIESILEI
jgi:hypothetical protein